VCEITDTENQELFWGILFWGLLFLEIGAPVLQEELNTIATIMYINNETNSRQFLKTTSNWKAFYELEIYQGA